MNRLLIALTICAASSQALACAPLNPELQATVQRSAKTFRLDPSLLTALIWTESRFCPNARSPVGAIGLGQLMPRTAAGLGVNPYDPHQNIYGAAKYLRQMWDRFQNWTLAIAAYNAGPGAVQRYRGIPPYAETRAYVRKVLGAYGQPATATVRTAAVTVRAAALVRVAARPAVRAAAPAVSPPRTSAAPATARPPGGAGRVVPVPINGTRAASAPPAPAAQARATQPQPQPSLVIFTTSKSAPAPADPPPAAGLSVFDASAGR